MSKTDKVYVLSNGERAVPEGRLDREVGKKNKLISSLFNRLGSAISARSNLFAFLGKSFSGNRDLYEICGYQRSLSYSEYRARYDRQEIAKACIDRPINSSWRKKPEISDTNIDEKESDFEKDVKELELRLRVNSYLKRLDTLSSIGQYAVLLFGFSDASTSEQLGKEVVASENLELKYISVFSEDSASIVEWELDVSNERYGLPKVYELSTAIADGTQRTKSIRVHHTRLLHVVPEALESDIYGIPQLKSVFNRLQDIETISAGSSEMYWKGARPGYSLSVKDDYDYNSIDNDALDEELDEYDHELRRFIRLQGIEAKALDTQIEDPEKFLDSQISLVACGRNIPNRILMGSERGELASGQDSVNWNERMENRRDDHISPIIIRPFYDRLIEYKVMSAPNNEEYNIVWPEFEVPGEESIVKNAELATKAIAMYAITPGIELIIPLSEFLQRFFMYSKEEADKMSADYNTNIEEENDQIEKDNNNLDMNEDEDEE